MNKKCNEDVANLNLRSGNNKKVYFGNSQEDLEVPNKRYTHVTAIKN
jgi:hypothetical protein